MGLYRGSNFQILPGFMVAPRDDVGGTRTVARGPIL